MIVIYFNAEGTATKLSPEHIYQGSNQSGVLAFAPTPPQTEVGIAFKLPDGTSTPYYHMTYQGNYEGLSQYEFTLPSSITQLAGHAAIALQAIYSDGQQTSQLIDFEIEESVVVVPPEPTPDAYDLLRQAIARNTADISGIQGQISNIESLAESADEKSDNAVSTANQAKTTADGLADSIAQANTTAQQAVDTANNAVNDIAQYKSETDSEIELFKQSVNGQIAGIESTVNSAVDTANDAKSTADGLASSIAQANITASEAKEIAEEAIQQSKVTGTKVNIAGEFATEVNFDSDPQEQLNILQTTDNDLQTQITEKVNKSGDTMSNTLTIKANYPALVLESVAAGKKVYYEMGTDASIYFVKRDSSTNENDFLLYLPRFTGTDTISTVKKTMQVDSAKLEPTTANGWTIGGNDLIIASDGVYLVSVTNSSSSDMATYGSSPSIMIVRGATILGYTNYVGITLVRGNSSTLGTNQLVCYNHIAGRSANWYALDIVKDSMPKEVTIGKVAYKKIA